MSAASSVGSKLLAVASNIERRPRPNNLFDLLFRFKNYGVGQNMYRQRWKKYWSKPNVPDCYVAITRVKVKRRGPRMNAGKAWGVLVWKGKLYHNGEERRLKSAQKRGWHWIQDTSAIAQAQNHMQVSAPLNQTATTSGSAADKAAAAVASAAKKSTTA